MFEIKTVRSIFKIVKDCFENPKEIFKQREVKMLVIRKLQLTRNGWVLFSSINPYCPVGLTSAIKISKLILQVFKGW